MSGRTADNPWQVLGLLPTCTFEEARARYKVRLQLSHPDRHSGSSREVVAAAAHETARINEAWLKVKAHFERLAAHPAGDSGLQQGPPETPETLLEKIRTAQIALGRMPSLRTLGEPTVRTLHAAIEFDLRRRALTELQLELAELLATQAISDVDRAVWGVAVHAWRHTLELNQIALNKHLKSRSTSGGDVPVPFDSDDGPDYEHGRRSAG